MDAKQTPTPSTKSSPTFSQAQKDARASCVASLQKEAEQALREMREYIQSKKEEGDTTEEKPKG